MKTLTKPELHPEFLTKNGKREFAVVPYEEYQALWEWIEDMEDLMDLRVAKEEGVIEHEIEGLRKAGLEVPDET